MPFNLGKLYHGVHGVVKKEKSFTIRVYPFEDYQLRSQESCSTIIKDVYGTNHPNVKFNKTQV